MNKYVVRTSLISLGIFAIVIAGWRGIGQGREARFDEARRMAGGSGRAPEHSGFT